MGTATRALIAEFPCCGVCGEKITNYTKVVGAGGGGLPDMLVHEDKCVDSLKGKGFITVEAGQLIPVVEELNWPLLVPLFILGFSIIATAMYCAN